MREFFRNISRSLSNALSFRRPSRDPESFLGRLGSWRVRAFAALALLGPGIISASADNDAGGITTYSVAGAQYGYSLLWILLVVGVILAITQEMGARIGVATGKGLAALIRERYGPRWTVFAMVCTLVANLAVTIAEFAGIAAAFELFGVPRWISVPIAGFAVWFLVVKWSYRSVERVFLAISAIYIIYPIAAIMVGAPWGEVIRQTVTPSFQLSSGYILIFIATIGTTITPWGQFFIQSYVTDKGVGPKEFKATRIDVMIGSAAVCIVGAAIMIATGSTLFPNGIPITDAADAARALEPLAGPLALYLFAIGLANASLLGASVVPLATAYTVTEAFGWEAGVDRSTSEAPAFHALYAFSIVIGVIVALIPGVPLVTVMVLSQDVNGVLLAVILIFAIKIASDREIMGRFVNGKIGNAVVWSTTVGLIFLTVLLIGASLAPLFGINL